MNDDFALLVDRDLPCSPFGISLGRMDRGCPLIPFATHGPFVTVRNDMLILACHAHNSCFLDLIRKS